MENRAFELEVSAEVDNLPEIKAFIDSGLRGTGCTRSTLKQILVAAEEVFVNVSLYAYAPDTGSVRVRLELEDSPLTVRIIFADRGVPYNPLENEEPDLSLSVAERQIGGLGIFLAKATMDTLDYRYEEGQNILTMCKQL